MKIFQTFILSLFILSLHQISYSITEHDVHSFGENDEYISSTDNNSEHGRLCVMTAQQNIMRNQQTLRSNPIAILRQTQILKKETVAQVTITHASDKTSFNPKAEDAFAGSPNSVWGWVVSSWSGSSKSTPDIK